jgi:hypothetical protein
MSTDTHQQLNIDDSKRGIKRPHDTEESSATTITTTINNDNDIINNQTKKNTTSLQNETDEKNSINTQNNSKMSQNHNMNEEIKTEKREKNQHAESSSDSEEIGPAPPTSTISEPPSKKAKTLRFEKVYLAALPSAEMYERSYMHRDVVTHIAVTRTEYIITASQDGHVKFWKKLPVGIEFVKHFRAHSGNISLPHQREKRERVCVCV